MLALIVCIWVMFDIHVCATLFINLNIFVLDTCSINLQFDYNTTYVYTDMRYTPKFVTILSPCYPRDYTQCATKRSSSITIHLPNNTWVGAYLLKDVHPAPNNDELWFKEDSKFIFRVLRNMSTGLIVRETDHFQIFRVTSTSPDQSGYRFQLDIKSKL